MAFRTDSRIGSAVASMRSASAEHNPFTTPEGLALVTDADERAVAGEAAVQLLHGLATLVELSFERNTDGLAAAEEVAGLLSGFALSIRASATLDARDAAL